MATAEEIRADILEWQNSGPYGPETSIEISLTEFLNALDWRDAEVTLPSGLIAKKAEEHIGREDDVYFIFNVNGQFFQVNGYYSSWDGTEWDEESIHEVVPEQVMVTQYKRKVT